MGVSIPWDACLCSFPLLKYFLRGSQLGQSLPQSMSYRTFKWGEMSVNTLSETFYTTVTEQRSKCSIEQ